MATDAHSHLSFMAPCEVASVVDQGSKCGLKHWVLGGYDPADWQRQLTIKTTFPTAVTLAFGVHPWTICELSASASEQLWQEFLQLESQCQWVGETGLDWARAQSPEQRQRQMDFFTRHLQAAQERPLVLHVVRAHRPCLEALQNYVGLRGIVHGFSGTVVEARAYRRRGFLLSVGPGAYKAGYRKLKETIVAMAPSDFVLESDAPDPQDGAASRELRGPVDTYFAVAQAVADLRKTPVGELLDQCEKNLQNLVCGKKS